MKRNGERLDSQSGGKKEEGRYDSSLENPSWTWWIKTNGLAQPMYLVKMKDKPAAFVKEYIKIISFESEVTCCAHRNTKKLL